MIARLTLLLSIVFLAGCATPRQVATLEGRGLAQVYNADFNTVWRATVDAAQIGDLRITDADKSKGYISARRGPRPETFGENVGIWVRTVTAGETRVEVVSRQSGPPKVMFKNWRREIHAAIRANLTREARRPDPINEPAGGVR